MQSYCFYSDLEWFLRHEGSLHIAATTILYDPLPTMFMRSFFTFVDDLELLIDMERMISNYLGFKHLFNLIKFTIMLQNLVNDFVHLLSENKIVLFYLNKSLQSRRVILYFGLIWYINFGHCWNKKELKGYIIYCINCLINYQS